MFHLCVRRFDVMITVQFFFDLNRAPRSLIGRVPQRPSDVVQASGQSLKDAHEPVERWSRPLWRAASSPMRTFHKCTGCNKVSRACPPGDLSFYQGSPTFSLQHFYLLIVIGEKILFLEKKDSISGIELIDVSSYSIHPKLLTFVNGGSMTHRWWVEWQHVMD